MKTINDIKNEIKRLRTESSSQFATDAIVSKNKKLITELTTVALYLETNPREEGLRQQLEKLNHTMDAILDRYPEWLKTSVEAMKHNNPQQLYREMNDIKKNSAQIEMLKYILS